LHAASVSPIYRKQDLVCEIYRENAFFQTYKEFASISDLFDDLYGDGICVNEDFPSLTVDPKRYWNELLIPTIHSEYGCPVRHLTIDIDAENYGDEPLIGYGLTYHSSFNERAEEFIGHRKGDVKKLHVLVEELRARLEMQDGKVQKLSSDGYAVVGEIGKKEAVRKIGVNNCPEVIDISNDDIVELWLLDSADVVYDFISSTEYQYRYEPLVEDCSKEESIMDMIEAGEGLHCEFKKYIDLGKGDFKAEEIDESVCAFSNADGGELIIGVTDKGEVIGISAPVRKKYAAALEDSVKLYIKDIRKRLYENLTESDCFNVQAIELQGKSLVVISVAKSRRWNFVLASDVPYKRRGSTNFNATRLVAMEFESKNSLSAYERILEGNSGYN